MRQFVPRSIGPDSCLVVKITIDLTLLLIPVDYLWLVDEMTVIPLSNLAFLIWSQFLPLLILEEIDSSIIYHLVEGFVIAGVPKPVLNIFHRIASGTEPFDL